MASAPKSNRAYVAFGKAMKDVEASPFEPVPLQLRNPVTRLMKDVGYGKDYAYAHDFAFSTTDMETFPKKLKGRKYYEPGNLGLERDIQKRIDWWNSIKNKMSKEGAENQSRAKKEKQKITKSQNKKLKNRR
jgi:putative ATPase